MAYTLLDIATRAQTRARDTGFSVTEAKAFVNDTQNAVANEYLLRLWEKDPAQSYTLVVDTSDITDGAGLPTDFILPKSLLVTTAGKEQLLDRVEYDDLIADVPSLGAQPSGVPNCWYPLGEIIYVYPKPDVAYTVDLRYQRRPVQLSGDADVPEIPPEFAELLVYGAAYRMFEEKDMDDKAAVFETKYLTEVSKLVNRYTDRQVGQAHYIKFPRQRRYAASNSY